MDPTKQRGFLNNNPGNMDRAAGEPWQGEIRDAKDARLTAFQRNELISGRFAVFAGPEWGIRAMAKNLFAYRDRLGLSTVRGFINKWAPPNENDTAAYIGAVAQRIGVSADAAVDLRDYKVLSAIVDAIIRVECGGMPYAGHEIEDGLRLAGVVKPVGIVTSNTARANTAVSVGTAGNLALNALQEPIQQAAESLAPLAGTSHTLDQVLFWLKVALGVIALVGAVYVIRERMSRQRRDVAIETAANEAGT